MSVCNSVIEVVVSHVRELRVLVVSISFSVSAACASDVGLMKFVDSLRGFRAVLTGAARPSVIFAARASMMESLYLS